MKALILLTLSFLIPLVMSWDCPCNDLVANCQSLGLSKVPQNLPQDITTLYLYGNNISCLPTHAFSKFPSLRKLDLSASHVTIIHRQAFSGLYNLTWLSISNNYLPNESFPDHVFSDLENLRTLHMVGTSSNPYPDRIFPSLRNLKNLYINTMDTPVFGKGFSYLTKLEYLQMDEQPSRMTFYNCMIGRLTNNIFLAFENITLKCLVINNCKTLRNCENGVFEPLKHLSHLELSDNQIGIHNSLNLLWPFAGRTMSAIILSNVFRNEDVTVEDAQGHIIHNSSTFALGKICVSNLSLSRNKILYIENGAFDTWTLHTCLEKINLSSNSIIGDLRFAYNAKKFKNLSVIDLSNQHNTYLTVPYPRFQHSFHDSAIYTRVIYLPPKLRYLDLTSTVNTDHPGTLNLRFKNTNCLEVVLLGYNIIYYRLHIEGLDNVTELDLSGHNLYLARNDFFARYHCLRKLTLRNSDIGLLPQTHNIFQNVTNPKYLDLSQNRLFSVPTIYHADKVEFLNLSNNVFNEFPLTVKAFPNLKYLDLSFNNIGVFDAETRSDLDTRKINVSLRGNAFSCGCSSLDFITWLQDTQVVVEHDRRFQCIMDNGTDSTADHVAKYAREIRNTCIGKRLLILTIITLLLFVISLLAASIVSRNPVRYENLVLKLFGLRVQLLNRTFFPFTAYVGYCEPDIPFVYRLLRPALEQAIPSLNLFLKDRDALPGEDIADAIVEGINNSWKTILVLSPEILLDQWFTFTMNSAVYATTELIPNRIIILLTGEVEMSDIPDVLLSGVDEDYIVRVEDYQEAELWRHLRYLLS